MLPIPFTSPATATAFFSPATWTDAAPHSNGRNDVAFPSDVGLTFTPCSWFTTYAYYGHAFGQEVIRQAFVSPGADYGYVEMTFSF